MSAPDVVAVRLPVERAPSFLPSSRAFPSLPFPSLHHRAATFISEASVRLQSPTARPRGFSCSAVKVAVACAEHKVTLLTTHFSRGGQNANLWQHWQKPVINKPVVFSRCNFRVEKSVTILMKDRVRRKLTDSSHTCYPSSPSPGTGRGYCQRPRSRGRLSTSKVRRMPV